MATINVYITKVCGHGCVTYNGSQVTLNATTVAAAGGVFKFKPKCCKKKFEVSVTNQDATNTLTLTRGSAVTSIAPLSTARFTQCKCKIYTVGIVEP